MAKNYYQKNKYHAMTIEVNGEKFDSIREYRRWGQLQMLLEQGKIYDLQRQVKFILIPTQREPDTVGKRGGVIKGKLLEKECSYLADFTYHIPGSDKLIVEDTKGMRTTDYIIKRKLMLYIHGIQIKEL